MSDKNETDLNKYKKEGKTLLPPLAQIGMTTSSWINDRLPEMLWAVLIISGMKREEALEFFRYCLTYVDDNNDLCNVTLSGIATFPLAHRIGFLKHITSYEKTNVKDILRPLLLFKALPAYQEWQQVIGQNVEPETDWTKIADGLRDCLWHQSQEATDCRWVKVAALIRSKKLQCPADMAHKILFYPGEGDQREVRPIIRSTEMIPHPEYVTTNWPKIFWNESYERTGCIPEQAASGKIEERYKELRNEVEELRPHFLKQTTEIRHALIDHFFETSKTSDIDARQEAVIGFGLFGLEMFIENNFYRTALSVNGRVMLRILFETYVTFAYLLKKESEDPTVWADYRAYGSGQANLIYRKFEENNLSSSTVDRERVEGIANEDKWVEFTPINLGHWDSSDLRKMCEYTGEKDLYDKYYSYTSAFVHANWLGVRESVFQKCFNPLHRLHRVPTYDLPLMSSVTSDMLELTNNILELVSKSYPKLSPRLSFPKENS